MNTELISTIAVCIAISILTVIICDIFITCMVIIAKTIAKEEVNINFKPDLIIIIICTIIIYTYFLI